MKKLFITTTAIVIALSGMGTVAQASLLHPTVAAHTESTEVRVQSKLKTLDYYHGLINGKLTSETRTAIRHYQKAHHLHVTGNIDKQLLRSLHLL